MDRIEKVYYEIDEVAAMFDLPTSTLRYWDKEFGSLSSKRVVGKGGSAHGTRRYTQKDVEKVRQIHQLLKVDCFTIKGAKLRLGIAGS